MTLKHLIAVTAVLAVAWAAAVADPAPDKPDDKKRDVKPGDAKPGDAKPQPKAEKKDDVPGTGGPLEIKIKPGADLPDLAGTVKARELRDRLRKRKTLLEARDLGQGDPTDTMEKLLRDLDDVHDLLNADLHTGKETQKRQAAAVGLLDKLIDEAIRMQQSSDSSDGGGGAQDPSAGKPRGGDPKDGPQNSGDPVAGGAAQKGGDKGGGKGVQGDGGVGGMAAAAVMKAWGQLPPAVRDQIVTGVGEKPHPDYKKLVEDFYTKLGNLRKEE